MWLLIQITITMKCDTSERNYRLQVTAVLLLYLYVLYYLQLLESYYLDYLRSFELLFYKSLNASKDVNSKVIIIIFFYDSLNNLNFSLDLLYIHKHACMDIHVNKH